MEFSRQEYWSGLPCPPPEDLPNPGTEPGSPTLQADSGGLNQQGSPPPWQGNAVVLEGCFCISLNKPDASCTPYMPCRFINISLEHKAHHGHMCCQPQSHLTGNSAMYKAFTTFSPTLWPASCVTRNTPSSVSQRPGCRRPGRGIQLRIKIQTHRTPSNQISRNPRLQSKHFLFTTGGEGSAVELLAKEMQIYTPFWVARLWLASPSSHRTKPARTEVRKQTHNPTLALSMLAFTVSFGGSWAERASLS